MKPQNCLFLGALLLLTATLSRAFDIECSKYDSDLNPQTVTCNAPSEACGIDRITGAIQGCVSASQCPGTVVDNRVIVCDASKPSCCCLDSGHNGIECNDILHPDDDSQWKQACTIALLQSPSDVCKVNPTRKVYCAYKGYRGNPKLAVVCRPFKFCGIAKIDGEMKHCLPPRECPASGAKGSKKVVCDGSASHCCCQDIVDSSGSHKVCNYILNEKDSTIWQQACSLKELSGLPVCKEDPSKQVYCAGRRDNDYYPGTVKCKPSEFCGIDKSNGEMKECLDATQCPSSVSDKIVCDSSKPYCCCRKVEDKHGQRGELCNHISNERDNTVWKQACSLPQLANLPVCQEDPTKEVRCSFQTDAGEWGATNCKLSEFCGIDKTEGKMLNCLAASECPAGAGGSDTIFCDDTAPNCCCQKVADKHNTGEICNNIWEESTSWQQACEKEQLKNLAVCKHDPTKKAIYCEPHHDPYNTECHPFQFCGIDKKDGEMKACLSAKECPAGAQGSDKIVCDDSAANCCCQKVDDRIDDYDYDKDQDKPSCNNILNSKDITIWKQACALEQLKGLNVCKAPPTIRTTQRPTPNQKADYKKVEEEGMADWEIALIVISVLIILAVIVCGLYVCYRKRGRNAVGLGAAVQSQQQTPGNAQDGQQPLVGDYYPVQQGYNLQAGQSTPLVPVNPAYQQPYAMSMPNMRYY